MGSERHRNVAPGVRRVRSNKPHDAGNYGSLGKVNVGFCVKKWNGRMTNSCHIVMGVGLI